MPRVKENLDAKQGLMENVKDKIVPSALAKMHRQIVNAAPWKKQKKSLNLKQKENPKQNQQHAEQKEHYWPNTCVVVKAKPR